VLRKFGVRLWMLLASLLVLTILGGLFFASVLDQARIGSQRYQSIIAIKDLQAEVQAPSLRLSEAQLTLQSMALAGVAVSESDIAVLERLQDEYHQADDVWEATVTDRATRSALATANKAATDYFSEVDGPFATAAQSGDTATMSALLAGSLGEKYVLHEAAVDDVARVAAVEYSAAERAARQSLQQDKSLLLVTILGLGLAGVVLTALTVRSLTSRLRAMREVASKDVPRLIAQAELSADGEVEVPTYTAPIVRGGDELARTERAFHRVVGSAVELAADQARLRQMTSDMLVYIGRRNHQRLTSGLTRVADLEGVPLGPERTSEMARLHSLMSRMRRDSESMLVVAGVAPMRSWDEPVSVSGAVEAALTEVDGVVRIHCDLDPSCEMPGAVASDLAHLVSELVDNALAFSEPETNVTITGRQDRGGYELLVSDDGLGIEPQQLALLNDVLANGEVDLHDSRRLGLSVVARLAFRNDVGVSLSIKSTGGMIARVWLPPTCWVESPVIADPNLALASPVTPMVVPPTLAFSEPEPLPRRIRGASLHESLRDGPTHTMVIPELRSPESVRTTLSALALGQLAASELQDSRGEQQ
jgi:signal transduction histidine kinase